MEVESQVAWVSKVACSVVLPSEPIKIKMGVVSRGRCLNVTSPDRGKSIAIATAWVALPSSIIHTLTTQSLAKMDDGRNEGGERSGRV